MTHAMREALRRDERWQLVAPEAADEARAFADDVRSGLTATPKRLSCRFFYDERGAELFDRICDLPEYYLTRAETEILVGAADEIAEAAPRGGTLVELGSGTSRKTRLLLDALLRREGRLSYAPIDVSREVLAASARSLAAAYPGLSVTAIAAEYRSGLTWLTRAGRSRAPKLVAWLGSSIGNLTRARAGAFLARVRRSLDPGDRMLIGFDLRKDRAVLEAAYDDAAGVTAAFNKNLLARINRELDGTFDLDDFAHRARYREAAGRIEMHLVARRSHTVHIRALDLTIPLSSSEALFTERSVKYAPSEIASVADAGRLRVLRSWHDTARQFSLVLLAPA